jgi:hypothetical protein
MKTATAHREGAKNAKIREEMHLQKTKKTSRPFARFAPSRCAFAFSEAD